MTGDIPPRECASVDLASEIRKFPPCGPRSVRHSGVPPLRSHCGTSKVSKRFPPSPLILCGSKTTSGTVHAGSRNTHGQDARQYIRPWVSVASLTSCECQAVSCIQCAVYPGIVTRIPIHQCCNPRSNLHHFQSHWQSEYHLTTSLAHHHLAVYRGSWFHAWAQQAH